MLGGKVFDSSLGSEAISAIFISSSSALFRALTCTENDIRRAKTGIGRSGVGPSGGLSPPLRNLTGKGLDRRRAESLGRCVRRCRESFLGGNRGGRRS